MLAIFRGEKKGGKSEFNEWKKKEGKTLGDSTGEREEGSAH